MNKTVVIPDSPEKRCPQCGTPLENSALGGLCPACLLQQGATADTATGGGTPAFNPPTVAELVAKFPQLEILELIGKGGMGAVYKARQKELDRFVALKILPPGVGDELAFPERFSREAKALAKLNHPGIVTIHDFGRAEGLYYFVMEFVDGVNLRQLLQTSRISAREALAIVPQICDALQYAHDQGIVHRDIKPENILMDRRGRVKVADFGLAKLVGTGNEPAAEGIAAAGSASITEAGKIMGTPNYMAPEQFTSPGEVDHRADIYALGVVFYQMLTGELPGKRLEPPSKKVQIDVRLDEIVLRALEKNPERRYDQASVLKTQVETIAGTTQANKPFTPPQEGHSSTARRWTWIGIFNLITVVSILGWFVMDKAFSLPVAIAIAIIFPTLFDYFVMRPKRMEGKKSARSLAFRIAGVTGLVTLLYGVIGVWTSKDVFYSETKILLRSKGGQLLNKQRFEWGFETFSHTIKSEEVLHPVIKNLELEHRWGQRYQRSVTVEEAQSMLRDALSLRSYPETAIVSIKYYAPSSEAAEAEVLTQLIKQVTPLLARQDLSITVIQQATTPKLAKSISPKLIAGLLNALIIGLVVGLIVFGLASRKTNHPTDDALTSAMPAVEAWLALGDKGEYARAWETAAPYFQRQVTKETWIAECERVYRSTGPVSSRKLVSTKLIHDGQWLELKFAMKFEDLSDAFETVTFARQASGEWQAVGHFVFPARKFGWLRWGAALVLVGIVALFSFQISKINKRQRIARGELPPPLNAKQTFSSPPFIASYGSGTVEIIGLAPHPSTNGAAWLPDGQPAIESFPWREGKSSAAGQTMKEIAFRVRSESGTASSPVTKYTDNVMSMGMSTSGDDLEGAISIQRLACPPNVKETDVLLLIADGPWESVLTIPVSSAKVSGSLTTSGDKGHWEANFQGIAGKDGDIAMSFNFVQKEAWETRLVSMTTNGTFSPVRSSSTSVQGGLIHGMTSFSKEEFSTLKEFHLQRRKYHWLQFYNVSLEPGHRTRIEVAGEESLADQPHKLRDLPKAEIIQVALSKPISPWAWQELERRGLDAADAEVILNGLIAWLRQNYPNGFDDAPHWLGSFLGELDKSKLVTEVKALEFAEAFYGRPSFESFPRIRSGDLVSLNCKWSNPFKHDLFGMTFLNEVRSLTIDGQEISLGKTRDPSWRVPYASVEFKALVPGTHILKCEIDTALVSSSDLTGLDYNVRAKDWPPAKRRWIRIVEKTFTVHPKETSLVGLSDDPALNPASKLSVQQVILRGAGNRGTVTMAFSSEAKMSYCFNVSIRFGDKSYPCGFLWKCSNGKGSSSGGSELTGPIDLPPSDITRADIILTPQANHSGIQQCAGTDRIWGKEILFKEVPIKRQDRVAEKSGETSSVLNLGPSSELLLKAHDTSANHVEDYLDLDTGRQMSKQAFATGLSLLIRDEKMDVSINSPNAEGNISLRGFDLAIIPAPSNHWEKVTAEEVLAKRLDLTAQQRTVIPGNNSIEIKPQTDGTDTYFFRTREGGLGVLQIKAAEKDTQVPKIRYKLVRSDSRGIPGTSSPSNRDTLVKLLAIEDHSASDFKMWQADGSSVPETVRSVLTNGWQKSSPGVRWFSVLISNVPAEASIESWDAKIGRYYTGRFGGRIDRSTSLGGSIVHFASTLVAEKESTPIRFGFAVKPWRTLLVWDAQTMQLLENRWPGTPAVEEMEIERFKPRKIHDFDARNNFIVKTNAGSAIRIKIPDTKKFGIWFLEVVDDQGREQIIRRYDAPDFNGEWRGDTTWSVDVLPADLRGIKLKGCFYDEDYYWTDFGNVRLQPEVK